MRGEGRLLIGSLTPFDNIKRSVLEKFILGFKGFFIVLVNGLKCPIYWVQVQVADSLVALCHLK